MRGGRRYARGGIENGWGGKGLGGSVVCSANGAAGRRAWLRFALFTREAFEVFEILELDLLAWQAYRQAQRPDRQFA